MIPKTNVEDFMMMMMMMMNQTSSKNLLPPLCLYLICEDAKMTKTTKTTKTTRRSACLVVSFPPKRSVLSDVEDFCSADDSEILYGRKFFMYLKSHTT